MVPVTAIGHAADPVHHFKSHRGGADIGLPMVIGPTCRHAGAGGFLPFVTAATLRVTGAKGFEVLAVIIGRETARVQLDGVGTQERPAVIQRHIHLQHGVMRLIIRDTTGAARTPVVVIERDSDVLLAIEIGGIGANAAF